MKCDKCRREKSDHQFPITPDGYLGTVCMACLVAEIDGEEIKRKSHTKTPEANRVSNARWRAKNREAIRRKNRETYQQNKSKSKHNYEREKELEQQKRAALSAKLDKIVAKLPAKKAKIQR